MKLVFYLRQQIFAMPKPDGVKQYAGLSSGSGEYTVVELSAVISNNENSEKDPAKAVQSAQAEYQRILEVLTSTAEVNRTPIEELEGY